MILHIDDNRKLELPDEMSDETARQLKRWILTLEERAQTAESEVRMLRDEMTALRRSFANTSQTNAGVVNAIGAMQQELSAGLRQVFRGVTADRKMVADEITGDMTRSKVILG